MDDLVVEERPPGPKLELSRIGYYIRIDKESAARLGWKLGSPLVFSIAGDSLSIRLLGEGEGPDGIGSTPNTPLPPADPKLVRFRDVLDSL